MAIVPWKYNNPVVDRAKLPKQTFIFQGHQVEMLQDMSMEIDATKNTAFKLWDGAFILARHLENTKIFSRGFWKGKRCIELGAGCGLVGFVAWMLGADVTLTDMPEALEHTAKCMNHNVNRLLNSNEEVNNLDRDHIRVDHYMWGSEVSHLDTPYDVILGSDIMYQAELSTHLMKSFHKLCDTTTMILLSYKPRGLGESNIFPMLKQSYNLDKMAKADHPQDFMDSDYEIFHISKR